MLFWLFLRHSSSKPLVLTLSVAGYTLLKIGSKHCKVWSCALQFGAFSVTFEGDEEKQISGQVCEEKPARNGGKTKKFWTVGSAPSASF